MGGLGEEEWIDQLMVLVMAWDMSAILQCFRLEGISDLYGMVS